MTLAHLAILVVALAFPLVASAQSGAEPPADTAPIAGDELKAAVDGKSFTYAASATATGRVQYQEGGYVYLNLSTGLNDRGKWKVDADKLCYEFERVRGGCFPMRAGKAGLYVKRGSDGLWAQLVSQ